MNVMSSSQPSRNVETSTSSAAPSPNHTYRYLSLRKEACEGLRLLYESSASSAEYSPTLDPLTAAFGSDEGSNFTMNCLPFADESLATLVDLLKCGQTQEYSEHNDEDVAGAAVALSEQFQPRTGSEVDAMVLAPDNDGTDSKGHGNIEGRLESTCCTTKGSEQQSGTANSLSSDHSCRSAVSCQRLLRLSAMSRLAHILQQRYINASLVVTERNLNTLGEALGLVMMGSTEGEKGAKREEVKSKHISSGIKSDSLNISCTPSRQKPIPTSESDNTDNAFIDSNINAASTPPRTTVRSFSDGAGDRLAISLFVAAAENTTKLNSNNFGDQSAPSIDHDAARSFLLKLFRQSKHAERRAASIYHINQISLSSPTSCSSSHRDPLTHSSLFLSPSQINTDQATTTTTTTTTTTSQKSQIAKGTVNALGAHNATLFEKNVPRSDEAFHHSYARIAHRIAIRLALLKDDSQTIAKRYRLAITRLHEIRSVGGGGGDFGGGGLSCLDPAAVFNFSDSESDSDDDDDYADNKDVNNIFASIPQPQTVTETLKRGNTRDPHGELSVCRELHTVRGPASFLSTTSPSVAIPGTTTTATHYWCFTSLLPHIIRIFDLTTRLVLPQMERDLKEFCSEYEGSIDLMDTDDNYDDDYSNPRVSRDFSYEEHFSVVSASLRLLYEQLEQHDKHTYFTTTDKAVRNKSDKAYATKENDNCAHQGGGGGVPHDDARPFDYESVKEHIVRLHAAYGRFLGLLEDTEKLLLHTRNNSAAHVGVIADAGRPLPTVSTGTTLWQTPFNTAPLTLLNTSRTRAFVGTDNKNKTRRAPPQGEKGVPFAAVMRGAPPMHPHFASASSFCGYDKKNEEGPVSMAASRLRESELIPNGGVGGTHLVEGLPARISTLTTAAVPPKPTGSEQTMLKAASSPPPRMRFSYTDASGLVFPYESPCAVWLSQFLSITELEDAMQLLLDSYSV